MKRICVFCGSNFGAAGHYREAAAALGGAIARRGLGLVYGGGKVGLMGAVADGALAAGGEVIGVIPEALMARELGHDGLTTLHVVGSMHERKAMMAELSDAFIAMPGGLGTFEEIFEVWTWTQLGSHTKPVALHNVEGFYDPLLDFIDKVVAAEFMKPAHREMLVVGTDHERLLDDLQEVRLPTEHKWIGRSER